MTSRIILPAVAAATLCVASLSSMAQGRVYDRNASNNPEIYQQTHPEDRSNPQLQGAPLGRSVERGPERSADRDQRQAERNEAARNDAIRRERDRANAQRHEADRRHEFERRNAERHNWDHRWDRRDYGYVVPRPSYYGAPQVVYAAPQVYYGAAPQAFYPSANPAPIVFRQGDYLPAELRSQQFVVQDWYWRGLAAPPFGYQWMQLGADNFALVLATTGQIVSLVATR